MDQGQLQDPSPHQQVQSMAGVATTELDRIAQLSDTAADRLVQMVAESEQLRLERDKLQLELARANSRALTRLSIRLDWAWWGLQRVVSPVGAIRSRAQKAVAVHLLDPVDGVKRLFFDPAWYRMQVRAIGTEDLPESDERLLQHFIAQGEAMGLQPTPLFDPRFYAAQAGVDPGRGRAVLHFLEHGLHLALAPRAGLEGFALRALSVGQTPAAWLFALAAELQAEAQLSSLIVES